VIPVCGQCSAAKATCAGFSNVNQDIDVPRSVVQFLESAIAKLEIELSTDAQPSLPSTSPVHPTTDSVPFNALRTVQVLGKNGGSEAEFINSPAICAMVGATTPIDPSLTDLVSRVRMGLTPSSVLPAISGTSPESRRGVVSVSVDSNRVECSTLLTLPDHVINALTRKFVRHVVPQMPILLATEIADHLDAVLAKLRRSEVGRSAEYVQPSFDFLVIYIVLAISSTLGCAKSQHESRCIAFSEILFREGCAHLSAPSLFPNELAGIQANLLMLLYAEINPNCGNIWILAGAVMRSCIDLGMHREIMGSKSQDVDAIEKRRRIFWMACEFPRILFTSITHCSSKQHVGMVSSHSITVSETWILRIAIH
jgi:hypothetical protein